MHTIQYRSAYYLMQKCILSNTEVHTIQYRVFFPFFFWKRESLKMVNLTLSLYTVQGVALKLHIFHFQLLSFFLFMRHQQWLLQPGRKVNNRECPKCWDSNVCPFIIWEAKYSPGNRRNRFCCKVKNWNVPLNRKSQSALAEWDVEIGHLPLHRVRCW